MTIGKIWNITYPLIEKAEGNSINWRVAVASFQTLFEAGENTSGIKISAFIDILTTRSGPQLKKSKCLKCVNASAVRFDSYEAETAKTFTSK